MGFQIASEDHIKQGRVTDVYFERVASSLEHRNINPIVSMEVRAATLPGSWKWAIFTGLEEVLELVDGLPVYLEAIDEGQVFHAGEPVLCLTGKYLDFGIYETSILGLICQASGIATNAARCRIAAGERTLISFGARRMHPALAPMIERNAFVGGFDGVAVVESARQIGEQPSGTMSHTLILCAQDEKVAYEAFDEVMPPEVNRIALIDTFQDEKFGAIYAAEVLGNRLNGVRLDTPTSRRGVFEDILDEVRWELDIRGYENVKLFVSGGINEEGILKYNPWADAYGVGTHISNSPVINFAMDIVEIDGKPSAKRGKKSGRKQLWECPSCKSRKQTLTGVNEVVCTECGSKMKALLSGYLDNGKRLKPSCSPREIREGVLQNISGFEL